MTATIGVLGGMGPYATVDFLQMLLRHTQVERESDHFRILVDNNPKIPSRTRAFLFAEADPVPLMQEGVKGLISTGADLIAVPCNSAHFFLPRVFEGLAVDYVDMVAATSIELSLNKWSTIGLLAGEVTVGARLYEKALEKFGIEVIQVGDKRQPIVRSIIEDVKNGRVTTDTESRLSELYQYLMNRGSEAIVLGCTELQSVSSTIAASTNVLDSLDILARETIKKAIAMDCLSQ